jgi:hypothetical protein
MPRLAYVDSQIVPLADASVSVEDRGLQFADSVYEVCAVLGGCSTGRSTSRGWSATSANWRWRCRWPGRRSASSHGG